MTSDYERDKSKAKTLLKSFEGRMIQLDAADIADLMADVRKECALLILTTPLKPGFILELCKEWMGDRSGEARPEAGRDDAADWDPCRWCSAGIETVRHLPGGTCPRTGRTRPGRERAKPMKHILSTYDVALHGSEVDVEKVRWLIKIGEAALEMSRAMLSSGGGRDGG